MDDSHSILLTFVYLSRKSAFVFSATQQSISIKYLQVGSGIFIAPLPESDCMEISNLASTFATQLPKVSLCTGIYSDLLCSTMIALSGVQLTLLLSAILNCITFLASNPVHCKEQTLSEWGFP